MKFIHLFLLVVSAVPPLLAADSGRFPAPAKVTTPTKEASLASLTLTAEAEQRLGIVTVPVEQRPMPRSRFFGGEVMIPATRASGQAGSSVFTIPTSPGPAELVRLAQAQIDADGQVEQARVQLESSKLALARAEQLLRDKAGSARVMEEAKAQQAGAEAGARTAQARRDLLGPPVLDAARQTTLWLRVPVYVGDLDRLNTTAEARAGGLAGAAGAPTISAKPVTAPPSANAAASSVDLFYEIENTNSLFRLGQRVGVSISMRGELESLVVPWSAVLHDVHGGTWVYEKTGSLAYTRRRVEVIQVLKGDAILSRGVKPGAKVVITGAAELFGTEFGVGK